MARSHARCWEEVQSTGRPKPAPSGRLLILATEDWFVLSHFRPLIATLKEYAREIVVVTRSSGRIGELEALGTRVIEFDYHRSSRNPAREALTAWRLSRILSSEKPDMLHIIAMKPIVLGGLALSFAPSAHVWLI